jgi:hypothetical protein
MPRVRASNQASCQSVDLFTLQPDSFLTGAPNYHMARLSWPKLGCGPSAANGTGRVRFPRATSLRAGALHRRGRLQQSIEILVQLRQLIFALANLVSDLVGAAVDSERLAHSRY